MVIADRLDKRKILLVTQTARSHRWNLAVVSAGGVTVGILYGFSAAAGLVQALDNPARRSFVREMVSQADVSNAVSLVSMVFTSARIVGPAISGILLYATGPTIVFAVNAVSYGAVLVALLMMRVKEFDRVPPVPKARGPLLDALRYSWANTGVRIPLLMMMWIGTMSFNFSLLLVLFAEQTFDAGSSRFGPLLSLSSDRSRGGRRRHPHLVTRRFLLIAAIGFGILTSSSTAPTLITSTTLDRSASSVWRSSPGRRGPCSGSCSPCRAG